MVEENGLDSFQVVEHTADWALAIRGRDLPAIFRLAAAGMAELLVGDPATIPLNEDRFVRLEATDAEDLLVLWLGELAYWAERDGFIYREFNLIELTSSLLAGTVRGGRVDHLQKHIKAVTYHNLAIQPVAGGLSVTVVFDV